MKSFKFDLGLSLGFYPNDRVLDKLIHESDVDNNMVIDFEEFVDLGRFSNRRFKLSFLLA